MSVYRAINAVQSALAKTGIAKDRTNTQGSGYKFRGIDDVYNALSPLLSEHGLCILPRMLARQCVERESRAGQPLFYVTVDAEFDFVCAEDGSKHTVRTFGEAMDSGDKATNKAMSAAYKYACFQAFAIPTEGDNDADAHTPDVAAKRPEYDVSPERAKVVRKVADACIAAHAKGDSWDCYEQACGITDNEEKRLLWSYLGPHSSVRSTIKQMREAEAETAAKAAKVAA